jgi:general secretion pathway protein K
MLKACMTGRLRRWLDRRSPVSVPGRHTHGGESVIGRDASDAAGLADLRRSERSRGFALLIVLWSMVLLALLFSRLVSAGRSEAEIAFNLRHAAQLQAQADGVLYDVIFGLLGGPGGWTADGSLRRIRLIGGVASVSVANLAGRVDPNSASAALLDALLHRVGADAPTADAVSKAMVDWRSPDAAGRVEAPHYAAAGLSYAPPGSPFQSIGEIGLVLGMTPALLTRLAPHLSLYIEDDPDPRYADPVVMQALKDAGMGAVSSATPHPPHNVTIDVVIRGSDGAEASRSADVLLNASATAAGFEILTWRTGRESAQGGGDGL